MMDERPDGVDQYARNQQIPWYRHRNVLQRAPAAKYGTQTGVFSITDFSLIEGHLPKRIISLVLEWAFEHRDELMEDWELARAGKPLHDIPPLV